MKLEEIVDSFVRPEKVRPAEPVVESAEARMYAALRQQAVAQAVGDYRRIIERLTQENNDLKEMCRKFKHGEPVSDSLLIRYNIR